MQNKIRVDSALYGNVILIVILASNIWSSHGQNVNPQHDDAADYVGAGGDDRQNVDADRVVSSGEVMASRLPVLNEHEPSCEELKAMWRYIHININKYFNRSMPKNENATCKNKFKVKEERKKKKS